MDTLDNTMKKQGNILYEETLLDVIITAEHIYKLSEEHDEIPSPQYEEKSKICFLASDIKAIYEYKNEQVRWVNTYHKCIPSIRDNMDDDFIILAKTEDLRQVWKIYLNKLKLIG